MKKSKILTRILLLVGFISLLVGCGNTKGHTITFMVNDTIATKITVEDNISELPQAPSTDGYIFIGWYLDDTYTTILTKSTKITGNIKVYAKLSLIKYTISYTNTFDATNDNPISYNVETDTIKLNSPSRSGYLFEGWYNGDTKVEEIEKGTTGNITLDARWVDSEYTITYNNLKNALNPNTGAFNPETPTIELQNLSDVDGYKFKCWNDKNGNPVTSIPKGTAGDVVLTAEWDIIEYTITYNDEFNLENNSPTTYNIESDTIKLPTLSKPGYTFEGWYNGLTKVEEITTGSFGNLVLDAKWIVTSSITYDEREYYLKEGQVIDASFFNAKCYDENGNDIQVTVKINGQTTAGSTFSATLSTANSLIESVTIENIKVYGTPSITATKTELPLVDDISTLFIAKDSFGELLDVTCSIAAGELKAGSQVTLNVTTVDKAGNTNSANFSYTIIYEDIFEASEGIITGIKDKNLKHIVIPEIIDGFKVTGIGDYVFSSSKIISISLPSGLQTLGKNAFNYCSNLPEIKLPSGVTTIGERAFYSCKSLTKITIPSSVTTVDSNAFGNNSHLTIFAEASGRPSGWASNWVQYIPVYWGITEESSYSDGTLMYVFHEGQVKVSTDLIDTPEITVPSTITVDGKSYDVTVIGNQAFYGCTTLTKITLPSTITTIGDCAFITCINLKYITIPAAVTYIGALSFRLCNSLTIYCLASSTEGWNYSWNDSKRPIVLGESEPQE